MTQPVRVVVAEPDNIMAAVLLECLEGDEFSVVRVDERSGDVVDVVRSHDAQVLLVGPAVPRSTLATEPGRDVQRDQTAEAVADNRGAAEACVLDDSHDLLTPATNQVPVAPAAVPMTGQVDGDHPSARRSLSLSHASSRIGDAATSAPSQSSPTRTGAV